MKKALIRPQEIIESKIFLIRGKKVMLDRDLAGLYGVKTKVLIQAVKRNCERFPDGFMYQLKREEVTILRSQFVTSSWGGLRYLTLVHTPLAHPRHDLDSLFHLPLCNRSYWTIFGLSQVLLAA